jgi:hypothetical protein
VELHEYDIHHVNKVTLGRLDDPKKLEEMFKTVFGEDARNDDTESPSFYASIPDTVEDSARYLYVRFLLCRKASALLLPNFTQSD